MKRNRERSGCCEELEELITRPVVLEFLIATQIIGFVFFFFLDGILYSDAVFGIFELSVIVTF